ncbi:fimbrial protein [Phytobacter sp. V91]|uniref:fimbrial protein n=1 Tax=Phytobacter sp. V91 TaxID=3369425 RepID=UPI003F5F986E
MRVSKTKTVLLMILAFVGCRVPTASSYDVLLNVTGFISGNTCTVAMASQNISVSLGNVGNRQFLMVGEASPAKTPFIIRLENCGPTFEGAKITFSGVEDSSSPQFLKIDDGGATGVAVEILDSESQSIPLNRASSAFGAAGQENVDILFYARLVATSTPVTSGDVNALATYTVEYI